jgi:hypothetical protein
VPIDGIPMKIKVVVLHEVTIKRVFGSVVMVAFQIAFRAEIYVNDFFLFFKNYF